MIDASDPVAPLREELALARLCVNDWHACATAEELNRWRLAQQRLIDAAKAIGRAEAEAALAVRLRAVHEEHKSMTHLEQVGDILGCIGAFTPQDVIDMAGQVRRSADRMADEYHRAEAAEARLRAVEAQQEEFRALAATWREMVAAAEAEGPIEFDELGHASRWAAIEICAEEVERLLLPAAGGIPAPQPTEIPQP